ncbi:hypothetical protein HPB52_022566 [Rhipicephalus sanguineus]|uniref:DDE Tnp4 domain-containing protein n=1 Tax=Rhipicephalus sanguineus TaxID=34632 RepID=A0A9D4PHY3_RHISA|nr:hypothetical protein HPB52_022566 [Rhipicephalus sanguineus]
MEFCPGYFDELVGPTRVRYEAKIAMCSGVDPYNGIFGWRHSWRTLRTRAVPYVRLGTTRAVPHVRLGRPRHECTPPRHRGDRRWSVVQSRRAARSSRRHCGSRRRSRRAAQFRGHFSQTVRMDAASCKKLIVLLESSSSSDSEDDTIIVTIQEHRRERPKVDNFVADVVASFDDEEFRRHFRLSRSTCELLTRQFAASPQYPKNHSHGGTPQKSAEEHILAFLWYAGNKATFRSVAQLFGMSESTLHEVVDRVADFLEAVAPKYLKMPLTEEEKQQTSVL